MSRRGPARLLAELTGSCARLAPPGKGGKNRRRGKGDSEETKRELIFKDSEGQGACARARRRRTTLRRPLDRCACCHRLGVAEYAQVLRMLGNGRVEAHCMDGKKRLGHIRGKMRKRVWVNTGDIVLVALRDFQDEKCDVIMKYNPDEARKLQRDGQIPESFRINETDFSGDPGAVEEEECAFVFEEL